MKQRPAPKLLIVEDVKSTRMLVKSVLGKEGYQVFDAADGLQGVETFEREHPDVILMDVMMPVMNGFDACRRIRALDSGKDTPIIMLTGAEDIEAIETAFDAGATDFITKPISWPLLTQRLRYAMRGAELMREVRQNRIREAAAQRIAKVAFWGWHPATDGFMHSDDLPRMLDLGVEQLPSLHSLLAIVAESDRERARRAFTVAESSSTRIDLEVRTLATDGERIIRIIGERGAEGRDLGHFFGAIHDISETRRTEALIDYLALHDELTGLGNRRMFSQTLHKRLTEFTSRDEGYRLLIGWIDLHRFHRLNDELGETAGDAVLKQIADRLRAHGSAGTSSPYCSRPRQERIRSPISTASSAGCATPFASRTRKSFSTARPAWHSHRNTVRTPSSCSPSRKRRSDLPARKAVPFSSRHRVDRAVATHWPSNKRYAGH